MVYIGFRLLAALKSDEYVIEMCSFLLLIAEVDANSFSYFSQCTNKKQFTIECSKIVQYSGTAQSYTSTSFFFKKNMLGAGTGSIYQLTGLRELLLLSAAGQSDYQDYSAI
jgi:hypothetical protein